MSKKNIGATLALYPCPVIVVGAMVNDKPTWTLVAHAGTVAHSHLMVSLVQAHYCNYTNLMKWQMLYTSADFDLPYCKTADCMNQHQQFL